MASGSQTSCCNICTSVPWFSLQPEDVSGTPHHASRKALEASAKSCPLCQLVLKAATSSYRDTRGVRNGRGYWREFTSVRYHDVDASVRNVMYVRGLGACMSASASTFKAANPIGPPVVGPTGAPNPEGEHVEESLELEGPDPPDDMPVWVYGNFWATQDREKPGDTSHLRLVGVGARFAMDKGHFNVFDVPKDQIRLCGSSIGLCTDDESSFAKFIPGRLRELHSDSDKAFRRVETWISDCSINHPFCGAPEPNPELPRRVLDVLAYDRGVMLLESSGQRGRYVTLSHCWGTSSRLMATRESAQDLKEGIAVSFLPKTFQDAIKIARKLGIKYLWIDCLCIVQDDAEDWEAEATNMANIYRNAYATIAAAASTDSYYGCFPKRTKDSYASPATRSLGYDAPRAAFGTNVCSITYENLSNPEECSTLHFFEEWLPGSSFHAPQRDRIGSFGKRIDPIAAEPLSSRGWTLQERLLAPRIIHYATDQLYFECETSMRSEDGFTFTDIYFSLKHLLSTQLIPPEEHGMPRSAGISFIVGRYPAAKGHRWDGGWISLVEDYTRRCLTVEQDKLPAVAGVAAVVAAETGDRYLAGLWAAHIYEDLCWRVYCQEEHFDQDKEGHQTVPRKGRLVGSAVRPKEYRAPSWSWASLDAPIKYIPLSYSRLVATVTDIETTPVKGDDLYRVGRLESGSMRIQAPIYEVKPYSLEKAWDRHGIPVTVDLEDERGVCLGEVHADFPDEPLTFPCYAVFLDPAYAVIVRPHETERQTVLDPQGKGASDRILTTTDANRYIRENPALEGTGFLAAVTAVRVGLGVFIKNNEKKKGGPEEVDDEQEKDPKTWDEAVDGKLTLDKVLHVQGDESWGPITEEDPWVWLTIV